MSDHPDDDLPDDLPGLRDHLAGATPHPIRHEEEALAAVVALSEPPVIEMPAGSELRFAYCPNGWVPLMRSVVTVLDEEVPGWTLRDSKADVRQLDIYVDLPDPRTFTHDALDRVRAAIGVARSASATVCEWCGAPAGPVTMKGWHSTLCEEHGEAVRDGAKVPMAELRARDE